MTRVAVLIPLYMSSITLRVALESLAQQSHTEFKVYLNDDTPADQIIELECVKEIMHDFLNHLEFDYVQNSQNLGYPKNLMSLVSRSSEEFVFLLAQDDVLSPIAIESCVKALNDFPEANAVSRPYYWFDQSLNSPIRQIPNFGSSNPELVTTESEWFKIERTLVAASQLTGLMYRRSGLREPFVNSIFQPTYIHWLVP
jgi:GT2 family glycosyltransferase